MKKIKVLLLAVYTNEMNEAMEEIGIAYIAAYLRENGFEVMLIGANINHITYNKIVKFKPDIAGLTAYTISREEVYSVCEKLRALIPDLHICLGGLFPTYYHKEILKDNDNINSIARGEGETVLLALAECLNNQDNLSCVKGLTYRQGANIYINEKQDIIENMDKMPFPHKDMVVDNKLKHVLISTSRGCTSGCSFCVSRNYWGNWRGRSISNIISEIKHIIKTYNITSFDFVDSSFEDPDPGCKRMIGIAEGIIKENIMISYYAQMRADFCNKATPEIMNMLKKSGLCAVFLGIETANDADRAIYNKRATIEDNYRALELFNQYNIAVSIGFINFNPYSTFESLHANIAFLERYNYARFFDKLESRFIIYNNQTLLYERLLRDKLIKNASDCFCFEYSFVDERIEKLSDFLTNYFDLVRKSARNYYGKLNNYNYMHINMIRQLYRRFDALQDNSAYTVVRNHENDVNRVLTHLNKVNNDWFCKLLELAKQCWNENTARDIIDQALSKNNVNRMLEDLTKAKHELYENLMMIKPEYIKSL